VVVFSVVAQYYSSVLDARALDTDGYCKLAICYKKLGEYDKALEYYKIANSMSPNTAAILGEMADCYALCGEDQTSKVLFREAFFLDASKVDIRFFDSELFCRLLAQVQKARSCAINELLEWIPVYGVLFGVFNVKRQLRAVEIGRLQTTIYSLENTMREAGSNEAILKPRLINHYFWLLDHYMMYNESREKINEVLLKIKILDGEIYEKYTN
jgi:tetratricopeptide (TPR) repeat protein